MQTRVVLLTLTGIKMPGCCFDSKMTCGPFSHTWWHVGVVRGFRKYFRGGGRLQFRLLLSFLDPNELCEACARHHKRRYQHPKPPGLADTGSREHDRDNEKRKARKNILERLLERDLSVSPASYRRTSVAFSLRELAGQSLWHQADV